MMPFVMGEPSYRLIEKCMWAAPGTPGLDALTPMGSEGNQPFMPRGRRKSHSMACARWEEKEELRRIVRYESVLPMNSI